MNGIELHRLAARARGWIEAQPVGPERKTSTVAAYRRYAERGLSGFSEWDVPEDQARRMVAAGTRLVFLERLEGAVELLDESLRQNDAFIQARAAAEVNECLAKLKTVPPRRPGRRSRVGGDQ